MKNVRNSKSMKRLSGYVMAGALAFGLAMTSLPAVTAEAGTIQVEETATKIKNNTNYTAYQVFAGTYNDTAKALEDISWGSGVNSSALLTALTDKVDGITTSSTAKEAAKALAAITDETTKEAVAKIVLANIKGDGTALKVGQATTVADGYYLIVDTTTVNGSSDVKVNNAALLRVVDADGTITIKEKTDYPEVEKKVYEDDAKNTESLDANNDYGTQYNDVADYTIGDTINFHLIGTIPDMSQYDTYKYEFHDTLSKGLDNATNIKVYISDDKVVDDDDTPIAINTETGAKTGYDATAAGNKVSVTFSDLKSISGATEGKYIIVTYDSALNSDAVVGLDGNTNEVYLTYSSNPSQSGDGDNDTTNTPVDYNIVFTYEVEGTKIDAATADQENPTTLKDAEFYLKNEDGSKYAKVNIEKDDNGNVTSSKFVEWTTKEKATILTSDKNGLFSVAGIDEGTYYLEENKAPSGYNKLTKDVEVVVEATTKNSQTWNGSEDGAAAKALEAITISVNGGTAEAGIVEDGKVTLNVENSDGTTLPETGGTGRRMIYILGSSLVAAVGAIFGFRKRRA